MNDSLYEALRTGINAMIFVVAMTAGLMLMGSVNDLTEQSKDVVHSLEQGSLVNSYGDIQERTFTGAELVAIKSMKIDGKIEEKIYCKIGATKGIINCLTLTTVISSFLTLLIWLNSN